MAVGKLKMGGDLKMRVIRAPQNETRWQRLCRRVTTWFRK